MTGFLVGLGCFALHAIVSLVWLRLPGRMSPVARHAASALSTHVVGIAVAAEVVGPFSYWPAAAVSGFAAVAWLFAFSAVYKSVSLRILTRLARETNVELAIATITEEHIRPEFQVRAELLVRMGLARKVDCGYLVSDEGKETVRWIEVIQRTCGIVVSGMYGSVLANERKPTVRFTYAPRSQEGFTPPAP